MRARERMPEDVKARWVRALRSGDYEQGHITLFTPGHAGDPDEWCCLGVLGDVCNLPVDRAGTLGLLADEDARLVGLSQTDQQAFATLNDELGWSFEQIADYIEGKVEYPDLTRR